MIRALAPALLISCVSEPEVPRGHAPALDTIEATAPPETLAQSEWLKAHLKAPAPPQGTPPETWTDLEKSLQPEACGSCHVQQYTDWKESWHYLAMGPGTMGQLVDWDGTSDRTVGQCNRCHANLSEQYPRIAAEEVEHDHSVEGHTHAETTYIDNPDYDPALRDQGLTCAGCHVRDNVRYGPAKPHDTVDQVATPAGPHGGYVAKSEFKEAGFCAGCHDFKKNQLALEGKLIQETGEEWRRTSFAAEGVTCQSCHMPEGRHLWKGIHDKDMVASGVDIALSASASEGWMKPATATLSLTNTGTGHRFPTYTTPEVRLIIEQVDAAGAAIESTSRDASIARRITPNPKTELYDTRLLPGETYTFEYAVGQDSDATELHARVEVWPDEAYRRFYEIKLKKPENHVKGEEMLRQALQDSIDSRYVLWEQRIAL